MKLSDKKRLNILDAAEELFYQYGVEHVSMDQIAKTAQASKRTVYNHFSTKEELFQAILTRMLSQLNEAQVIQYAPNTKISDQLRLIAQQEVALLTSEQFLRIAKITFMQMLQNPLLAQSIESNEYGCMRYLPHFLENAMGARILHIDNIEFAAKQFIYALKGFIFYPVLYGFETQESIDVESIIEQTIETFLARYEIN